jgi:adenylyl-sulfate kinase
MNYYMDNNLKGHIHSVSLDEREKLNGHKSACIWFTGLSGSGKSSIADRLDVRLSSLGYHTFMLDGDKVHHGLNKDLGFSNEDRKENIRRVAEVAKLFADSGLIVITSFISPFARDRKFARTRVGKKRFLEVYVKVPIEVCQSRDPKGLYKKTRIGQMKEFTGIDSPYEEPGNPEIIIENLNGTSIAYHVNSIIGYLAERKIIKSKK